MILLRPAILTQHAEIIYVMCVLGDPVPLPQIPHAFIRGDSVHHLVKLDHAPELLPHGTPTKHPARH